MKNERARIRSSRGFTLAETLMAILILLMVTAIVAAGIPVASNALKKAVEASHAQVLLSTTMTALRDELTTAKNIRKSTETVSIGDTEEQVLAISYTDDEGIESMIYSASNGIHLKKIIKPAVGSDPETAIDRLLVSQKAATSDLRTGFSGVEGIGGDVLTISGLAIKRGSFSTGSTVADMDGLKFKIKVVS